MKRIHKVAVLGAGTMGHGFAQVAAAAGYTVVMRDVNPEAVARGRQEARASVVDVVPTILYFLGLPLGRDMDGYARTDLFQRSFTDERPIAFIPTYDR